MQDEGLELTALDDTDEAEALDGAELDASDLGGTGEYSATGGYSQPLHDAERGLEGGTADDDEMPDGDSLREMYQYSLGRATQDASPGRLERWVDGPLHLEDPRRGR